MLSAVLIGVNSRPVRVTAQADVVSSGIRISGLAGRSVKEAAQRVSLAMINSGLVPVTPPGEERIEPSGLVHLGPSDLPKEGAALDLGIAIELAHAMGLVKDGNPKLMCLGELGINGDLMPTRGILALLAAAPEGGTVVVPQANLKEATLARLQDNTLKVFGAETLREACLAVEGRGGAKWLDGKIVYPPAQQHVDLSDVIGHTEVKKAMLAAAVGGLHVLLTGPAGTGKSLMAKASPGLLPRLTAQEALEVTRIWSASGHLQDGTVVQHPPYIGIDPNTTLVGLLGGGPMVREVGAVSRAHLGVLHLDEMQDFNPRLVDSLRGVMENGYATVSRMGVTARLPARCQLIATCNPCPCGWSGVFVCKDCGWTGTSQGTCRECSGSMESRCGCSKGDVARVNRRMSGPIMDRFDVKAIVGSPRKEKPSCNSKQAARQVGAARKRLTTLLGGRQLREVPGYEVARLFEAGMKAVNDSLPNASIRRQHRTLKLALCFAALDERGDVNSADVKTAAALAVGS